MENKELLLQDQILAKLRENRELGAELLLEAYTPLLWSVCLRRLSNPEDVKECINDVFADFCMNLEKYDPQQTSLRNYLAMMADRRAISYYRKNLRRNEAENAAADLAGSVQDDQALELEEALSRLKPEDAQIIRYKYYDGMTYREIAQRIGISEDAVKKRGTRSLRKLAKWLIIGLLLVSILAGCAYVVHRYFRYSKGVGIIWDNNEPMYQLMEVPEPVAANGIARHLLNVTYSEETLTILIAYYPEDDTLSYALYNNLVEAYDLSVNGRETVFRRYSSDVMVEYGISIPRSALTADENGLIQLQLLLAPNEEDVKRIKEGYGYEMDMSVLTWDIVLEETDLLQDPTDLGTYLSTPYADFLITTDWEYSPESEDSFMLISLYPDYKEDGLVLSELVSTWYVLLEGYDSKMAFLTDAAGNSYPLFRTSSPTSDSTVSAYTLWFRNVPPGEYTLNIPSLCYRIEEEDCTFTVPLPKEDDTVSACDEMLSFPHNTTVHITGVTRQTHQEEGSFLVESWEDGVQNWEIIDDTETQWTYLFVYELITDDQFPLCAISLVDDFCYLTESGLSVIQTNSQMTSSNAGLDSIMFGIRDGLGMEAPDALTITLDTLCYMDVQSYSIPITIK